MNIKFHLVNIFLNIDCALIELKTPFGYYGPMVDIEEWSNQLHSFIENNSLQNK